MVFDNLETYILTARNLSSIGRERILNNDKELPVIKGSPKSLYGLLLYGDDLKIEILSVSAGLSGEKGRG
jgi:hypothetical protein